MMADKMLERGDLDGRATWKRILKAIEELRQLTATGEAERGLVSH